MSERIKLNRLALREQTRELALYREFLPALKADELRRYLYQVRV